MKMLSGLSFFLSMVIAVSSFASTDSVFEVKAVSTNSVFYADGKVQVSKGGDEVVYQVNIPEKTITRTAVYNKGIKDGPLGGVQSDDTSYEIFHVSPAVGSRQRLIKAFGRAGLIDGYEVIVIGNDFVTTSKSAVDYFVLYYYKRTDLAGEQVRREKQSEKSFLRQFTEWLGF